jgi:hypothetical protein
MKVKRNPKHWTPRDTNEFFSQNKELWRDLNTGKEVELNSEQYEQVKDYVIPSEKMEKATGKSSGTIDFKSDSKTASEEKKE